MRTSCWVALVAAAATVVGCGSDSVPRPSATLRAPSSAPRVAYVTNDVAHTVAAFVLDPQTPTLRAVPGSPFELGARLPRSIAVAPSGDLVFVTCANEVAVFHVEPGSGALRPVEGSPFGLPLGPGRVPSATASALDPAGPFLYVASTERAGSLYRGWLTGFAVHSVSGRLSPLPGMPLTPGEFTTRLARTTTPPVLYAANSDSKAVSAHRIAADGSLEAVAPGPFRASGFPRALALDSAHKVLYAVLDGSRAVGAYRTDPTTGVLTSVANSPFRTLEQAATAVVTPRGGTLYTVEGTSVIGYSIDRETAALGPGRAVVTGLPDTPGYFQDNLAFDADGDYAFLVTASGFFGIYGIDDTETWQPIPGAPFSVGAGAREIAVVHDR